MIRARSAALITAAITGILLAACREGVPPFMPEEPVPSNEGAVRLTAGIGHDSDPRWTPDGAVTYHTTTDSRLPGSESVLLRLVPDSGALVLFPELQGSAPKRLAAPVYSPDGQRVAYIDLFSVDTPPPQPCTGTLAEPCNVPQPLLDSAVLRVRHTDAVIDYRQDPALGIKFQGTNADQRLGQAGPLYPQRVFPFQVAYTIEHLLPFAPSWSPDGQRIAFSDGLNVHIWRIGDAASTIVPGTTDGVRPVFSPDGSRLAFTLVQRLDSAVVRCNCSQTVTNLRTSYDVAPARLIVLRTDGSERIDLGNGMDPAWSPDGASLYAHRSGGIMRIPVGGGAAVAIPNTSGGRSPAVSPDGRRLAFMRYRNISLTPGAPPDWDIWTADLPQ